MERGREEEKRGERDIQGNRVIERRCSRERVRLGERKRGRKGWSKTKADRESKGDGQRGSYEEGQKWRMEGV